MLLIILKLVRSETREGRRVREDYYSSRMLPCSESLKWAIRPS